MKIQRKNNLKIAFCTIYNFYKYQVRLFKLVNTTISFQSYINKIENKKLNIFVIVYLNSILIYNEQKNIYINFI